MIDIPIHGTFAKIESIKKGKSGDKKYLCYKNDIMMML